MRRILFVDDEPRILEGLQRTLRPFRNEWSTAFANSGESAISMLQSEPFDVVVTDMRMPGMDGPQLLSTVRERFPSVIRIVLSGYFDTEAALRAAPVAHQFLIKPCDPGKLRRAVESALTIDSILSDDGIRRAVASVGALPTLPDTCSSLIRILEAPVVSIDRVKAVVQSDVAIAARIMQLAGSAAGLDEPVDSIETAISYIGLDALKYLLLSVELFQTFPLLPESVGGGDFSLLTFQRHSRLVASIAGCLPVAESTRPQCEAAAFLHDVGKLVLASRFPKEFHAALSRSASTGRPSYEVELELLGTDHAHAGAYLLGLWGVAPEIVRGISRHHQLELAEVQAEAGLEIGAAVSIADALAHHCLSLQASKTSRSPQPDYLERLRPAAQLPEWIERTSAIILGMKGPDSSRAGKRLVDDAA